MYVLLRMEFCDKVFWIPFCVHILWSLFVALSPASKAISMYAVNLRHSQMKFVWFRYFYEILYFNILLNNWDLFVRSHFIGLSSASRTISLQSAFKYSYMKYARLEVLGKFSVPDSPWLIWQIMEYFSITWKVWKQK